MTPWAMYGWLEDWAAIGGVHRPRLVTAWYAVRCWWKLRQWAKESAREAAA